MFEPERPFAIVEGPASILHHCLFDPKLDLVGREEVVAVLVVPVTRCFCPSFKVEGGAVSFPQPELLMTYPFKIILKVVQGALSGQRRLDLGAGVISSGSAALVAYYDYPTKEAAPVLCPLGISLPQTLS